MAGFDTRVVTSKCIGTKDHSCVDVCPVQSDGCFLEAEKILVIDPDICVGCALCESVCPVQAIFVEDDVPSSDRGYIEYNARMAQSGTLRPARSKDDWEKEKKANGTPANEYYKAGHKPEDGV